MAIDPRSLVAEALAEYRNPCCGSSDSHREGSTEYCSGCGSVLGPSYTPDLESVARLALDLIARTPCPRCHQDGSLGWHHESGRSWCRACGAEVERTDE